MKRLLFLSVTLIVALCMLTSCIIIPLYRHFRIDIYEVESIEIYDLPEIETYNYQSGFEKRLTPIYILSSEQKNSFLSDLGEIQFKDSIVIVLAAMDRSASYNRWSIKINYVGGAYDTLSCDGYGHSYDEVGECIDSHYYSCEREEWYALIEKYLPTELFDIPQETEPRKNTD